MTDAEYRGRPWHHDLNGAALPATSYTAFRLNHSLPEHLSATSRRCFIGPVPEGWLKSHRKEWYKHHLHINYSSRAATFSESPEATRRRKVSGQDGPSATALYGHSFPQPDGLEAEDDRGVNEDAGELVTNESPPALSIPRSSDIDEISGGINNAEHGESSGVRPVSDTKATSQEQVNGTGKVNAVNGVNGVKRTTSDGSPDGRRKPRGSNRTTSESSYVTAHESPTGELKYQEPVGESEQETHGEPPRVSTVGDGSITERPSTSAMGSANVVNSNTPESTKSTSNLLPRDEDRSAAQDSRQSKKSTTKGILSKVKRSSKSSQDASDAAAYEDDPDKRKALRGLVHFDLPEDSKRAEIQKRAKAAQIGIRRTSTKLRKSRIKDGQIVKMERMLVRVDVTKQQLSDDYDENESQKVETRTSEKWREFMVVCRQSDSEEADYRLQLYQTRVIPDVEKTKSKKRSKHEIVLGRKISNVNLYSSLDKTVAIWVPSKKVTTIYILQTRSSSDAVEWYTFLRHILGWTRAREVQVDVPDVSVSLRLTDPFETLEASREAAQAAEGDEEAILKTMREEQAVAGRIVDRCMTMLGKSPAWDEIFKAWQQERMGLCWKRYDRLEWVHGANERKMFGTIAMIKTHDLELRPKHHYPTQVYDHAKGRPLTEPPPVEGFLVRLTSQKGATKRLGRMFYKRLYFSTHNQFLVFSRPAKAKAPPPPVLPATTEARIPSSRRITENIPLVYAVNPYPVEDGQIEWLRAESNSFRDRELRDVDAFDEAERTMNSLLSCDGCINLHNVTKVRKATTGADPVDEDIDDGSDVDFNENVPDTSRPDGTTKQPDLDRSLELVLKNGLVIRLQAYNETTRDEWVKRLRQLTKYWNHRLAADILLMKAVRQQNLDELKIDEETEAYVGQFAKKWEVKHTFASPDLYNMCGVSCCRTIRMAGSLYRKPRLHATFSRCSVVLCNGTLLVFRDTLRSRTGSEQPQIFQDRISALDLRDCYLYSGLLAESDLLYQNQTFDSNKPGHHALPRIYPEDGWTSTDEDVMTCFVVWHGRRRGWFRSEKDGEGTGVGMGSSRLKLVNRLGVPGRSVVFRARSRAERDHWVLAIQTEIERIAKEEDFRIQETSNN